MEREGGVQRGCIGFRSPTAVFGGLAVVASESGHCATGTDQPLCVHDEPLAGSEH